MSWLNVIQSPQTRADDADLALTPGPTIDQLPAGAWEGTFAALGGGTMRGLARAGEAAGLAGSVPFVLYGAVTGDTDPQDAYFEDVIGSTRNAIDYWAPDATTTGRAAQVVGSLAEGIAPLLAGPEALLGAASLSGGADLSDEGASATGAVAGATVRGAATFAGLRLPATVGKTLAQRVAFGAGINVTAGAAARGLEAGALALAGDQPQADQRLAELADPATYTVDALIGAAFGVVGHLTAPRVSPATADALLAANNADHLTERSAPGIPADPASSAANQAALQEALQALSDGRPVQIATNLDDAAFVRRDAPAVRSVVQGAEAQLKELRELDGDTTGDAAVLAEAGTAGGSGDGSGGPGDRAFVDGAGGDGRAAGADAAGAATGAAADSPVRDAGTESAALLDVQALRQAIKDTPDLMVAEGFDDEGGVRYRRASEVLDEIAAETKLAEQEAQAYPAAVNCFLGVG